MKVLLLIGGLTSLFASCAHQSHPRSENLPEGHTPIFENDEVRVMEIINPPGGEIPLHNHDLPGVIIVEETAENLIRNSRGEVVQRSKPPRGAYWAEAHGPLYSIENIDSKPMHLYRIEIK